MDFSPWDWETGFRFHVAACLIAGVEPIAKRHPSLDEELPAAARPVFKRLLLAHFLALTQEDQPQDPRYPKSERLHVSSIDPEDTINEHIISREELRRWVQVMGIKSAYQFLDPKSTSPVGAPRVDGPAPKQGQSDDALQETINARCARLLSEFEAENALQPRGALARVVKRDGRTRQTVSADIKLARKAQQDASNPIAVMVRSIKR
jgi:hypothetical protein